MKYVEDFLDKFNSDLTKMISQLGSDLEAKDAHVEIKATCSDEKVTYTIKFTIE